MKNEALKTLLSLVTAWLQDPDSSSLAQRSKEAIKSFTIRFIISVFTIKRAVIVLGLFYLCLFILFHCLYKSHSHFVLLGFCPFQLLMDEWGRKRRMANKLGKERVGKLSFHGNLFLHLGGMKASLILFIFWCSIFMVPLHRFSTLDCCYLHQYPSLTVCLYFNGLGNPAKVWSACRDIGWEIRKQKWSVL